MTELPPFREVEAYKEDWLKAGHTDEIETGGTDETIHLVLRRCALPRGDDPRRALGMIKRVGYGNMHLLDASGRLAKYATPECILRDHAALRLPLYERRLRHEVEACERDLRVAEARATTSSTRSATRSACATTPRRRTRRRRSARSDSPSTRPTAGTTTSFAWRASLSSPSIGCVSARARRNSPRGDGGSSRADPARRVARGVPRAPRAPRGRPAVRARIHERIVVASGEEDVARLAGGEVRAGGGVRGNLALPVVVHDHGVAGEVGVGAEDDLVAPRSRAEEVAHVRGALVGGDEVAQVVPVPRDVARDRRADERVVVPAGVGQGVEEAVAVARHGDACEHVTAVVGRVKKCMMHCNQCRVSRNLMKSFVTRNQFH